LSCWCKKCRHEYYINNSDAIKERAKKWDEDNKERCIQYRKEYRLKNIDAIKERDKLWQQSNRDKCRKNSLKWMTENREKMLQYKRDRYKSNKEEIAKKNSEYSKRTRPLINARLKRQRENDPKFRLRKNISTLIYNSLKRNKNGHWEDLVGYTLDDLRKYLESQFTGDMAWENYGKWHIDHIIPVSLFNFKSHEDIDFKKCFELKNLQPLWKHENLSKGNNFEGHFQPSLAFA